ncbi:TerB family tellurite resistance protein [Mariprofundus sp. NF]|uniref:tellurite resistance TerB family protein n=1 Tax=Mariprofundus sp. NF TaxID=2608716 RepID=UPI0015A2601C|nr:TerB family tellurite resistance protein [Mariprofundus sp. NF]NWF37542.1 TerB family tellurite resistance protein [Mariprofundus sp. NF]
MIKKLQTLWRKAADTPKEKRQHEVSLAVTALMVEVMRMDGKLDEAERSEIVLAIEKRFSLSKAEVHELIEVAAIETEQALDLHQFTSTVVKSFSTDERKEILSELWCVAMADGHVDPYEEQLLRRMAELMGLHHSQFIQAKIAAELMF